MKTDFSLSLAEVSQDSPKKAFTPSSLLIPKSCLDFFYMRKKEFGSIKAYFLYLLTTYARHLARFGITPQTTTRKWKIKYQKASQELKKMSFIPDPCAWEAYRQLASLHGLSICHLFVLLLELDMQSWHEFGCPERQHVRQASGKDCECLPDTKSIFAKMEANGQGTKIGYRKNYRPYATNSPGNLNNFIKTTFFSHKLDFESKTLTRSGRLSV